MFTKRDFHGYLDQLLELEQKARSLYADTADRVDHADIR
jgi:hypothetical protein